MSSTVRYAYSLCLLAGLALIGQIVTAQVPGASQFPKTDFSKHNVKFEEIMSGGPPRDGIPSIDDPKFLSLDDASGWLAPAEPVIVVRSTQTVKAYPLQILIWHEIVNDTIAEIPITVTFCPLCNSSIVFDRRFDSKVLDFGTTGRLRKSDLVMYDRQTETWWQQLTGTGIVGQYTGKQLERIPAQIVSFATLRASHPSATVLSKETGHRRAYGDNPYRGYDSITDRPFLFFDPIDKRLPPMERVLNIHSQGASKIYPFSVVSKAGVVNDNFADKAIVVFSGSGTYSVLDKSSIAESKTVPSLTAYERRVDGRTLTFEKSEAGFTDVETGSTWDMFGRATTGELAGESLPPITSAVHFAFAWLAFNPDSAIYE